MLGLLRLGLSIELAHRLVLSGYALALPLAGLFCVRAAAPASAPLALLLLPLVWSWFAVQGLYNYVLSLPPALVWLGIVARDGGRPRPRRGAGAGGVGPGGLPGARGDLRRSCCSSPPSGLPFRPTDRASIRPAHAGTGGPAGRRPARWPWRCCRRCSWRPRRGAGASPQPLPPNRPSRAGRCTTFPRRSVRSSSSSPCAIT